MSQILGYTGPVSGDQLKTLKAAGLPPGRPDRQGRPRGAVRDAAARALRDRERRAGRIGPQDAGPPDARPTPSPGDSLTLTIDTKEQQYAQKALKWAMKEVGIKRGVVIVMNPQTGEVARARQPADVRQQRVRSRDQQRRLREAPEEPRQAAAQPRDPGALPARLHLQARGGHRRPRGSQDHRQDQGPDDGLPDARVDPVLRLEPHRASGRARSTAGSATRATRSSSRWPASSASTASATGPSSTASARRPGIDLPGEVAGIVPTNQWKQDALGAKIFPGETYQAGIGQGYDVVTPIQLINAYAALANGGTLYQPQIVHDIVGPDGKVVRPFKPKVIRKMKVPASVLKIDAQRRPEHRHAASHLQPGRPADQGRRQVRHGRVRHARQQGPAAVPLVVRRVRPQGRPHTDRSTSTDSQLVVLAFAYDSRTKGNVATEIVKYYLPAALRDQEGLPAPEPAQARQLLPEQLMGVIRAEPARITDWAAKSVGAAWRAFDLQLTTYAGAARRDRPRDGLHEQRRGRRGPARGRHDVQPRADVGRRSRSSSSSLATAFDYRWLKTLAWPIYGAPARAARPHARDRRRRRRIGALGHDRPADLPVQRDRQDPDDHRPRQLPRRRARASSTRSRRSSAPACSSARRSSSSCSSPTSGRRSSSAAILAGMLWMSGASLRWLAVLAVGVVAMVPIAWTYLLRDYQKARLTAFLDANPDIQGAGFQLHQAQIAVGAGGLIGKGLTNGTQTQGDLLPGPGDRLRVRDARRGARVHRRRRAVRAVRPAAVARPRGRLALARRVRDAVRGRGRLDDPVPARRQRRDGPRRHADHRHPAPVRDPRRRVAREHGGRARASSRASTSDRPEAAW